MCPYRGGAWSGRAWDEMVGLFKGKAWKGRCLDTLGAWPAQRPGQKLVSGLYPVVAQVHT